MTISGSHTTKTVRCCLEANLSKSQGTCERVERVSQHGSSSPFKEKKNLSQKQNKKKKKKKKKRDPLLTYTEETRSRKRSITLGSPALFRGEQEGKRGIRLPIRARKKKKNCANSNVESHFTSSRHSTQTNKYTTHIRGKLANPFEYGNNNNSVGWSHEALTTTRPTVIQM